MAGIIFDKELRTYIPRGGTCASACAYLFFAGTERLADGELGVHQAYSSNFKEKKSVGQTQYVTQFTVSEIIGFLNEFGTPAFVYERMFQDIDMYFFDPLELMELNSEIFGLENSQKIAATKFMLAKIKEQEEKEPELTRKEMIALIQTRLKEVGCNPGPADGIWGRRTQAAAVAFAKKAGLPTSPEELITKTFIEKLSEAPANYCPKPKSPSHKFYARYNYKCVNASGVLGTLRVISANQTRANLRVDFTNSSKLELRLFNITNNNARFNIGSLKSDAFRAYIDRNSASRITSITFQFGGNTCYARAR